MKKLSDLTRNIKADKEIIKGLSELKKIRVEELEYEPIDINEFELLPLSENEIDRNRHVGVLIDARGDATKIKGKPKKSFWLLSLLIIGISLMEAPLIQEVIKYIFGFTGWISWSYAFITVILMKGLAILFIPYFKKDIQSRSPNGLRIVKVINTVVAIAIALVFISLGAMMIEYKTENNSSNSAPESTSENKFLFTDELGSTDLLPESEATQSGVIGLFGHCGVLFMLLGLCLTGFRLMIEHAILWEYFSKQDTLKELEEENDKLQATFEALKLMYITAERLHKKQRDLIIEKE